MKKNIIGIDPGASGALSKILAGKDTVACYKCPVDVKDRVLVLQDGLRKNVETCAYIEKVHAMPHDGRSSLFKFGVNYGAWLGILESNTNVHKLVEVSPQKWMNYWQNKLGIKFPRDKIDRKRKIKEIAGAFINGKATLWNADSILITMYGYHEEYKSKMKGEENAE